MSRYSLALCSLLLLAWPRAVQAETKPRIAIVQCTESYQEDPYTSQMSSQAIVGLAVLLGVHYETLVLGELLAAPPDQFSGVWFSSCMWVGEDNHADLVLYLSDHLSYGGSVFLDGPLAVFYVDNDGIGRFRGMDEVAAVLGVDWGGWRNTTGYDIVTTSSQHPVAQRTGYGFDTELTMNMKEGTDTMVAQDASAEVLLDVASSQDGIGYPFLVVAEPVAGAKVAAIGGYGNFVGIASPFRNSPSTQFSNNQVLPYLLETLVWTTAQDQTPYAGLQVSHAPVTILGRLDGDWSGVDYATENTLSYLIDLSKHTGIATVYGIVSEFAEDDDTWPLFAEYGPLLQELGGSIGTHSASHPMTMSEDLNAAGWQTEVAGSFDEIEQALTTGGFAPDVYAFINPGGTIRAEDYGEFFDDVEVFLSHGFEMYTPYSTGVQGFGLPSGVPARAVINDVPAPDFQWLYSSSWDYTVDEAVTYQEFILDYYQDTVGRGVIYNMMWHDYSLGGNAAPEHYPNTPSVLPLFETSRDHFWENEVYAPTVAEAVGKLYVAQGTVMTSSYSAGSLQVDVDYSNVQAEYRAHIAGMGLRVHQQDDPIRRVVVDGVEHFGFSDDTVMMPAPSGATQQVMIEFGSSPDSDYRLRFASKPVSSVMQDGDGVVAALAQPGLAMRYCFAGPNQSVVLGASEFARTVIGEACGHVRYGGSQAELEIQPFETGGLDLFVRRATRPLLDAYAIEGGIHVDYSAGPEGGIEFASAEQPTLVAVNGTSVVPQATAEGFSVTLPSASNPGALVAWFTPQTCDATEAAEVSCNDGADNDCDGAIDCADGDCDDQPACSGGGSGPRLVVLTDISDTMVRESNPQRNFGSRDSIDVDTASAFQYGLIKPDNLGDIAPGAQVLRAELVLQIFNKGDAMQVREVLGAWTEGQVTWNSAPPATQSAFATVSGDLVGEVSIDITDIAQNWVNGGGVHGIELFPTGSDGVDIHSSEYTTASLRPYFVLEVSDGGGGGGGQCDDADADGYLAEFCGGDDCDDADASSYPGAAEICDDGADNDCDGSIDCVDGDCSGQTVCTGGGGIVTVILDDLDDAYVSNQSASTNFGSSVSLEVDTWSAVKRSFIKPNSLGGISPGAQVVSAQLIVNIYDAGDIVFLGECLSSFSESSITWNNAPSSGPGFTSIPAGTSGDLAIDVTDLVQRWVDGAPVRGLVIEPSSSNSIKLHSTESSNSSTRPYFVIEVIQ